MSIHNPKVFSHKHCSMLVHQSVHQFVCLMVHLINKIDQQSGKKFCSLMKIPKSENISVRKHVLRFAPGYSLAQLPFLWKIRIERKINCGGLTLASCWRPTQPLSHSPFSVRMGEKIRWKSSQLEIKPGRSLSSCHHRLDVGKIHLLYWQLKYIWIKVLLLILDPVPFLRSLRPCALYCPST